MTKIIIVRHGESEGNNENIFTGITNVNLTDLGKKQAQKTAEYLSGYKIDKIYSSDLKRAYETAVCTANMHGLTVFADKRLREVDGGDWEGENYYKLGKKNAVGFKTWMQDIDNAACDNGEAVVDMKQRIADVIEETAKDNDGKTVAVFSHASPIKAMYSLFLKQPMSNIPWVKNASVTVVEYYSKDNVKFILTDYAEHLKGMVTFLPNDI